MRKNLNMSDWIGSLEIVGERVTLGKVVGPTSEMGALLSRSRDKASFFKEINRLPGWTALGRAPANVQQGALAF